MTFSWKNSHLILKLITLALLILIILVTLIPERPWATNYMIDAVMNTTAIVILVLIVSIIFLTSPMATEICLIIAVIIMLLIGCSFWPKGQYRYTAYAEKPVDAGGGAAGTEEVGYQDVHWTPNGRRHAHLGLTITAIIIEAIDVLLYAAKK